MSESLTAEKSLKAAYEATIAASNAQLLEAHERKQAAWKHAEHVCEHDKKLCWQSFQAMLAETGSEQAEEEKAIEETHNAALLAVQRWLEKVSQARAAAQVQASERLTEEVARQTASWLDSGDQGVCFSVSFLYYSATVPKCLRFPSSEIHDELHSDSIPEPGCTICAI